jgi:alpha-tubulin suppressor-like RCC1 family protein
MKRSRSWYGLLLLISTQLPVAETSDCSQIVIVAGKDHTCSMDTGHNVSCWGSNVYGQLGIGTHDDQNQPVEVPGLDEVVQIALGGYHTCTRSADETVKCWGNNLFGQLGDGTVSNNPQLTPKQVPNLVDVIQIVVGGNTNCVLLKDNTVKCWGWNYFKQIGSGSNANYVTTPTTVAPWDQTGSTANAVGIYLGWTHCCALLSDKTMQCWGANSDAQLGRGTTSFGESTPQRVSVISDDAVQIAPGYYHTCALLVNTETWCWGSDNMGQRGDGYSTTSPTDQPTKPELGDSYAVQISTGDTHTCAIINDNTVKCWGLNQYGETGNGMGVTYNERTPVEVQDLTDVVQLTSGQGHSCALLSNNNVKCWGRNDYGQLGNGNNVDTSTPVTVTFATEDGQLCQDGVVAECGVGKKCTAGVESDCSDFKKCIDGLEYECGANMTCTGGVESACGTGTQCTAGVQTPCPPGTFSDTGVGECTACIAGSSCSPSNDCVT